MKIVKRNGQLVEFSLDKIERAIGLALGESNERIVWGDYEVLVDTIRQNVTDGMSVEQVSDIIEMELMRVGLYKTAKRYILYRDERLRERQDGFETNFKFLSNEFLSNYKHKPNPFPTQMSEFTYVRSYSRYLPEVKRREYWWETVARVVEYNCGLAENVTIKEAETLFDNIYNLRQFPSGRSLWVANTEVSKKYPMSNYNCATIVVDSFDVYHEAFYLLLIGAGKGFRIRKSDIEKLPPVRTNIKVIDEYYSQVPKDQRKEHTEITFDGDNTAIITISDSKEGWTTALEMFIKLHYDKKYRNITTIRLNYDNIRPAGERLKTFGGYSSGHNSMRIMLNKIAKVFKNSCGKLKPIDAGDIGNIIGENVVSGGVRRTAIILLFDEDDNEMIEAKTNLYKNVNGKWSIDESIIHRQMSNNSILYWNKPTREKLAWQMKQMRFNGEPAFVNAEHASKRRENFDSVNACSEILLSSRGMCNLTEIVPIKFVVDGKLDEERLYEAQRLSARMGYRMTMVDFEIHSWDLINKRDRLIGCSITGWQDLVNELSMSKDEQVRILNKLREIAVEESKSYAKELGLNAPVLSTTNKPSGTISLLAGVSSGIHYSHSDKYIRRIRISVNDPLSSAMKEMGFSWKPEVGQTLDNCTTIVFEFPMSAPKGKTKYTVTAIEQLENYKMFMDEYANHNVSCTVTVRDDEWEGVEQWVWDNWDSVIGISFLPLSDAMYDLLPYEAITDEQYEEMVKVTPSFNQSLLSKYEHGEDFDLDEADCSGGICPIK